MGQGRGALVWEERIDERKWRFVRNMLRGFRIVEWGYAVDSCVVRPQAERGGRVPRREWPPERQARRNHRRAAVT